jgi:hypothetical protein
MHKMPSIPSSPVTPSRTRARRPSNLDFSSSASSNPYHASIGTSSSRRSSRTSQASVPFSPMTPHQQIDKRQSASLSIASDGIYDALTEGENMGNLADELADAWDEDGPEEPGSSFLEGLREGSVDPSALRDDRSPTTPSRKPVLDDPMYSPTRSAGNVKRNISRGHKRGQSRYEDSDHGEPSDVEDVNGWPPGLAREMANIEALARPGLNGDPVSEAGGVVSRTMAGLKDLGPQASIENGATRIITAYTSVANHRTQKTREICLLAQSLLQDIYPTLPDEEIDSLISELELLIQYAQLPPGPSALQSLQMLVANTSDLAHSLRSLSDTIQEARQAASAASRRLKNARDFVMELQQADEAREEGIRYLEKGGWDGRIRQREAHRLCGDVVAGFETTCDAWRYRLFGTLSTELV